MRQNQKWKYDGFDIELLHSPKQSKRLSFIRLGTRKAENQKGLRPKRPYQKGLNPKRPQVSCYIRLLI